MSSSANKIFGFSTDIYQQELYDELILRVDTRLSSVNSFTLALLGDVDITIDAGDGRPTTRIINPDFRTLLNINYTVAGEYTITVRGRATQYGNGPTAVTGIENLVEVVQWGLNIQSLYGAFNGAANLTSVPLYLPSETVDNLGYCFKDCTSFNDLNVNSWDTSNVVSMGNLFQGATSFNRDLTNWDTSKVVTMSSIFEGATSFNGNIDNWNTSLVQSFSVAFRDCTSFNRDISNWNVSSAIFFLGMFLNCTSFNRNLSNWNMSNATNIANMFANCTSFNNGGSSGIANWDTSNVESMSFLFGCDLGLSGSFNHSINSWNTSKVTNMSLMFFNQPLFNQPLNSWNVSNVTNMSFMFRGATSFNQPLNNWITSSLTNIRGIFWDAYNFNNAVSAWDTSKVTDMSSAFYATDLNTNFHKFAQPLIGWDTSSVTNMSFLFRGARAFNREIASWDTSKVTNMQAMFAAATGFNQDIGGWDVGNVNNMESMFETASSFNQDLSRWCVSNFSSKPPNWDLNANSAWIAKPVWGTCPLDQYNLTAFFDPNTLYPQGSGLTPDQAKLKWTGQNIQPSVVYGFYNSDGSATGFILSSTTGESSLNIIVGATDRTYNWLAGKATATSTIDGSEVVAYARIYVIQP